MKSMQDKQVGHADTPQPDKGSGDSAKQVKKILISKERILYKIKKYTNK